MHLYFKEEKQLKLFNPLMSPKELGLH